GANSLISVEVPQRLAGLRIHSLEGVSIVREKNYAACGCHGSAVGVSRTHLRILPGEGFGIEVIGQKELLWILCWIVFDAGRVIRLSFGKFLWFAKKSSAIFERLEIEKMGQLAVRRSIPVGRSGESRTNSRPFSGGLNTCPYGTALGIDSLCPIQFFHEANPGKEFAVSAIKNVDETISIGFDQ